MQQDKSYKLIIVGNGNTGKTTYVKNLLGFNTLPNKYVATIAVEVHPITLSYLDGAKNECLMNTTIWDTVGIPSKYGGLDEEYYIGADCAIIMNTKECYDFIYWYNKIRKVCPKIPIVVVMNDIELNILNIHFVFLFQVNPAEKIEIIVMPVINKEKNKIPIEKLIKKVLCDEKLVLNNITTGACIDIPEISITNNKNLVLNNNVSEIQEHIVNGMKYKIKTEFIDCDNIGTTKVEDLLVTITLSLNNIKIDWVLSDFGVYPLCEWEKLLNYMLGSTNNNKFDISGGGNSCWGVELTKDNIFLQYEWEKLLNYILGSTNNDKFNISGGGNSNWCVELTKDNIFRLDYYISGVGGNSSLVLYFTYEQIIPVITDLIKTIKFRCNIE